MTQPQPSFDPPPPRSSRTVSRIIAEALFVLLSGSLALGIAWELGYPETGWIIAGILWVCGTPALEINRVLQTRR